MYVYTEMGCYAVCADRKDHSELFTYVSRKAAGKGRALLEGLGLDTPDIAACFKKHPQDEQEAVHAGMIDWSGGHAEKSPTWEVLFEAMAHAQIGQQYVRGLHDKLGF